MSNAVRVALARVRAIAGRTLISLGFVSLGIRLIPRAARRCRLSPF